MNFIYNDGGRSNYFKGEVGDCVCRAICNTTGVDYKKVYDFINKLALLENTDKHRRGERSSARNGVYKETEERLLKLLGAEKIKVQEFGSNKKCHLCRQDLKDYLKGRYLLYLSGHSSSLIDGNIVDTYDCSRDGNRQVYKMYLLDKTPEEYNLIIDNYQLELDKKLKSKQDKQVRDNNRNIRISKKLEALDNQAKDIKKQINELHNKLSLIYQEKEKLRNQIK